MRFLDQLLIGIKSKRSVQNEAMELPQQGGVIGQGAVLFEEVGKMITQAGGVSGLARQFQQKGLGDMMAGWIGTGANPSISEEELAHVLGQDTIRLIASNVGLTEQQTTEGVSKLLPVLVDKLTPSGNIVTDQVEMENDLTALKSKFL